MTIGPEHPDHPGYQGQRPDPEQPSQQPSQQQWPTYGGPQQPGQQPYGYGQYGAPYSPPVQAPMHPQATTALVLGIIGLAGTFICGVTVLLGPFAWSVGARAKRQIAASPGQYRGESEANIGMILGIITTVLLVLAVIGIVLFIVFVVAVSDTTTSYSNT